MFPRNELMEGWGCLWTRPLYVSGGDLQPLQQQRKALKLSRNHLERTFTPPHRATWAWYQRLCGWLRSQITEKLLTFGKHSSFSLTSPFPSFHEVTCSKQSLDCILPPSHIAVPSRNSPHTAVAASLVSTSHRLKKSTDTYIFYLTRMNFSFLRQPHLCVSVGGGHVQNISISQLESASKASLLTILWVESDYQRASLWRCSDDTEEAQQTQKNRGSRATGIKQISAASRASDEETKPRKWRGLQHVPQTRQRAGGAWWRPWGVDVQYACAHI